MPIYEFFCQECNILYKFFSRRINTDKVPDCPREKNHKLERRVPLVAVITSKSKETSEDAMPSIDETKMEKAMNMLAREADKIDEDDPRQAAQLMRKLSNATGLRLGDGMEEALTRMEKGEDPEKIEQEMGELLEGDDPFSFEEKVKKSIKKLKPIVDDTLYDM